MLTLKNHITHPWKIDSTWRKNYNIQWKIINHYYVNYDDTYLYFLFKFSKDWNARGRNISMIFPVFFCKVIWINKNQFVDAYVGTVWCRIDAYYSYDPLRYATDTEKLSMHTVEMVIDARALCICLACLRLIFF